MSKVITDKVINLIQLDNELGNQGLSMNEENQNAKVITTADGSSVTQKQLEDAVKNHNAVFVEPSVVEKLASVGLNLDDLKAALGL